LVSLVKVSAADPFTFDVTVPAFVLEGGGMLTGPLTLQAWAWTRTEDAAHFKQTQHFLPEIPTVLILHPLHQGCDPRAYWSALLGPGRPFQPWARRIVSLELPFASGGTRASLPLRDAQAAFPFVPVRGASDAADATLCSAHVTTLDQAHALALALESAGIAELECAFGGSLGGMVALAFGLCFGDHVRTQEIIAVAAPFASTASMIGWSHVQREAIHAAGPALARQIARMVYRGHQVLEERQGRSASFPRHEAAPPWTPRAPFRMETYLRHHGTSFAAEADAQSYLTLLSAMDHHDLGRYKPSNAKPRICNVRISSDTFVSAEAQHVLTSRLRALGHAVDDVTLDSPYGHDGFLVQQGAPLIPMLQKRSALWT
jgi:homoserine O-acetyltransferase/O-succinyltransferase